MKLAQRQCGRNTGGLFVHFPSLAHCPVSDRGLLATVKKCSLCIKLWEAWHVGGYTDLEFMKNQGHITLLDPSSSGTVFLLATSQSSEPPVMITLYSEVVINIILNADTGEKMTTLFYRLLSIVKFWNYRAIFKSNFQLVPFILFKYVHYILFYANSRNPCRRYSEHKDDCRKVNSSCEGKSQRKDKGYASSNTILVALIR